jgi:hypothetical protein
MNTLTSLINTASATNTTRFAAQRGIFFDSMSDMVAKLNAEGLTMQQNDGERVLVSNKVWMTRHGVATPVTTANL